MNGSLRSFALQSSQNTPTELNHPDTTTSSSTARARAASACRAAAKTPVGMLPPALDSCAVLCPPAGPDDPPAHFVRGPLRYMHYGAQDFADHGWGCGFRTCQSMLSWLDPRNPPPTIPQCQAAIPGYSGGREWMGVPDAVALLDSFHGATVIVRHLPAHRSANAMAALVAELVRHFDGGGGPVMVGGFGDVKSKTVVGVRGVGGAAQLMVWDPHYSGSDTAQAHEQTAVGEAARNRLWDGGWVAWRGLDALRPDSFYNLGMPRAPPASLAGPAAAAAATVAPKRHSAAEVDWASLIQVVDGGAFSSSEVALSADWAGAIEVVASGEEARGVACSLTG